MPYQIVIDTNVLVAALRSRRGASFRVLSLVGGKDFGINISVPLVLEYEDAAKRIAREIGLSHGDIDDILDYICRVAHHCQIYFLWRPFLKDPRDDLVLDVAVEGGCDFIVTYNVRDFEGADRFGVRVVTPGEFLRAIGALP
ncbi:MAG: putative toxin-antitoxin system toxin component, PIN family [candidate division NC10 bacterium]|nr:putative toxin-antitoxin system toxin component, PIN family [candidate division NC10 bacterium]